MFGSLELGSLYGIRIRASWTFVALLVLLLLTGDSAESVASIALLLASVFLHELGHALVARSFGIQVIDITFWPLGGMARMSEIPERPRVEAWIAGAGPLVNLGLALVSLPFVWAFERGGAPGLASIFFAINLALGLFNLLPAFPMDGGRLLRAALAVRVDWVAATEYAVRVGRYMAFAVVVLGVWFMWPLGLFVMPLVGLFVFFAGASELIQVRLRHGRSPLGGGPMFPGGFPNASEAGPEQARTAQSTVADDRPSTKSASEPSGARRPRGWDLELDGQPGFSNEDIRRLERFRGRAPRDLDHS